MYSILPLNYNHYHKIMIICQGYCTI